MRSAALRAADGAATLTAFTARAVASALPLLPAPPRRWLVCGGGRHNPALMRMLRGRPGAPVEAVEAVGWRGDFLEAEAFAFLAVRSLRGLPLSLPSTTGAPRPQPGGRRFIRGVAMRRAEAATPPVNSRRAPGPGPDTYRPRLDQLPHVVGEGMVGAVDPRASSTTTFFWWLSFFASFSAASGVPGRRGRHE